MNVLDVIIILAYFVGMIVLGLIANKKQTGVDDYYLGGRSMGARWSIRWPRCAAAAAMPSVAVTCWLG